MELQVWHFKRLKSLTSSYETAKTNVYLNFNFLLTKTNLECKHMTAEQKIKFKILIS